jgi:hypothetical protein
MKRVFQALIIAIFLGAFAVPSFASVNVTNVNCIAAVDDEPKKKETGEAEAKSADNKEAEKKSECTKSEEEKASCAKEKASCEKEKSSGEKK